MAFHESSLGGNQMMMYPYLQQQQQLKDDHNHHIPNYNYQPEKSHQHNLNNIHLPTSAAAVLISHPPEKSDGGGGASNNKNNNNEHKLKRILHRDIERQRRQEMANLYASLRSLLPLEYIKGKRSISDHMQEAVNYIKYLENRIGEFRHRRNKLKIVNNSSGSSSSPENNTGKSVQKTTTTTFSPNSSSFVVTVNPCLPDCLEILIGGNNDNNTAGAVFPLSRVLKKLVNDELGFNFNVVSCISTKVNDRLVHKIVTQVNDSKCIDNMEQLQEKLKNALLGNFSN